MTAGMTTSWPIPAKAVVSGPCEYTVGDGHTGLVGGDLLAVGCAASMIKSTQQSKQKLNHGG
jgi:hypothetical protein